MNDDTTVVITNYNYGVFLVEAVESLLAQEGGPPRIIVVDDGSEDTDTLEILDELPPEVDLVRQANAGLSTARNVGLRRADTPFLIVLDADDRLRPGALRAMKGPLLADPKLGFAYGKTVFFGDWEGELTVPGFDPYRLLYRHTIGSTVLMRREVFEQIGGFDPAFRGYEDWDFWLSAVERGWRGVRVDEITFEYRRHGPTMLAGARLAYRSWYRRLRHKHAPLYARRHDLARESDLTPAGRAVYRWFWGERPIPARVEYALHAVLFRPKG